MVVQPVYFMYNISCPSDIARSGFETRCSGYMANRATRQPMEAACVHLIDVRSRVEEVIVVQIMVYLTIVQLIVI